MCTCHKAVCLWYTWSCQQHKNGCALFTAEHSSFTCIPPARCRMMCYVCPRTTGRKVRSLHHLCTVCIHTFAGPSYCIAYRVCTIAYCSPVCWGAAGLGSKDLAALGFSHMDERHLPLLCCKLSSFCMHRIHESILLHGTPQPC